MSIANKYSIMEGLIRQTMNLPIEKKYKMDLGLTHAEIITLLSGESVEFIFKNEENLPDIKVNIKEVEEDATLSETMQLSVDNSN